MKNILLVTSLYPCDGINIINNTAVCHYFAKEWIEMGYNVRVIFNYNVYPRVFYPLIRIFKRQMANIFGVSIQSVYVGERLQYHVEGILVDLIPIKKIRPGADFSDEVIERQVKTIVGIIDGDGFKPDFVLGHFIHPNLDIVVKLKDYYGAIGSIALHGTETAFSKIDNQLFRKVDMIGYRSFPIKWAFEKNYGEVPCFMCPSGVPQKYITQPHKFENGISQFIYVGSFVKRKFASALVPAIASVFKDENYAITFVGDGDGKRKIVSKAKEFNCLDKIHFTGRVPRKEIFSLLDKSDVFIMISKIETFGLVYLEALARGCVVVASKNEGMDGIIKDGVNGFLCEAGNESELREIIEHIKCMTQEKLQVISEEAIKTAQLYTDSNVARHYIKSVDKN